MDDAHACSDIIRDACRIRIPKEDAGYNSLRTLFAGELERQGVGSYAEICNEKYDAILPVPYWAWIEHESDVAQILSQGSVRNPIKYTWPLLKICWPLPVYSVRGSDRDRTICTTIGSIRYVLEGTHRVFMSATVTDDAFWLRASTFSGNH